jgi:hypothetical protein
VSRRVAEDVSEDQEHSEVLGQLVLAMRAAGMDPEDADDRDAFVKLLKKMTPQKLAMAAKRQTATKATAAGKAAKAASRE